MTPVLNAPHIQAAPEDFRLLALLVCGPTMTVEERVKEITGLVERQVPPPALHFCH